MSWKCSGGGGGEGSNAAEGGCLGGESSSAAPGSSSVNGSFNSGYGNERNNSAPPRWSDLHARVKEMRRTYSQLFVKTPTNIKFRLISEDCLRIYFLLCPAQGREATLFYADLNLMMNGCTQLGAQEVLETNASFTWRRTSREEQLLSERRRCSVWGITHYQLHSDSGTLVFPAASTIFFCQHPKVPTCGVTPKELPNSKVRLNPQLCPFNPHLMAFSANRDVFVFNSKTGLEHRVSYCHTGSGRLEQDPLSAGVPAYVMQEEFSRYQGYWWQPRSRDGVQRLLYEEVDESKVLIVQLMSHDQNSLEEFRFPRAGASNATSRLRLAELAIDGSVLRVLQLSRDLEQLAPWHQYLVRVGWTPCGQYVWCQLLERRQRRLDLLLLPLALFSQVMPQSTTAAGRDAASSQPHPSTQQHTSSSLMNQNHVLSSPSNQPQPAGSGVGGYASPLTYQNGHLPLPITLLSEQQEHSWIDVHNLLYWFKNEDSSIRTFIWGSEETGHRHLYLYRVRLAGGGVAQVQQKVALTAGDWSVLSKGLWVDESRGLVYFMGLKDTPLEHHLYVVSLQAAATGTSACNPQRLTTLSFSHTVYLNTESQVFVTCYSSVNFPGSSQVYRIFAPEHPGQLVSTHICAELLPHPASDGLRELLPLVVPDIVPVEVSGGITLYAMVFKPHNLVRGRRYPTVLHVYGGPQVQLVTNTFKGCRQMRSHMLAAHDFCVVSIDSRGSDNRGVAFQAHIRNRMGTVEIADQVEALHSLSERYPFIDMNRVGVFGWSYGGYLALMALAQRGDLFKVAVAGAPVVNWSLYDTGYTERYMDTPENNSTGYKNSSVISFIKNFPDEEGRLLIVQGIIDENVHFCHTSALIQHLVNAGKPYQLQVYPRERHCLRGLDSNEHYDTQLLHFLLKGL